MLVIFVDVCSRSNFTNLDSLPVVFYARYAYFTTFASSFSATDRKLRCSGGIPCHHCSRRQTPCKKDKEVKRRGKGKQPKRDKKKAKRASKAPVRETSHLDDQASNHSSSSYASNSTPGHHHQPQRRQRQRRQQQRQHSLRPSPVALYGHTGPAPSSRHSSNDHDQSPPPPYQTSTLPPTRNLQTFPQESASSRYIPRAGMISETRSAPSGSGPRIPHVLVPLPTPHTAAVVQDLPSTSTHGEDERDHVYRRGSGRGRDEHENRES